MDNMRFMKGIQNLKSVDGKGGDAVIQSLEEISPDLGKYIIEFAFGDIYSRPALSLQEREMITIVSLLTAGGCGPYQWSIKHRNRAGQSSRNLSTLYTIYRIS